MSDANIVGVNDQEFRIRGIAQAFGYRPSLGTPSGRRET